MHTLGFTMSVKTRCDLFSSIGIYAGTYNHIYLATPWIPDEATFIKVITHEALHVIQDCLSGGLTSSRMRSIGDYLISERCLSPDVLAHQFKRLHTGSISDTRHIFQRTDRWTGEIRI